MNYHSRFGMEFNPFIKNAPNVLVETEDKRLFYINAAELENQNGVLVANIKAE